MSSHFIPAILDSNNLVPDDLHTLLLLPVKLTGVGVPGPTSSSERNHHASRSSTAVLTESLRTGSNCILVAHQLTMAEGHIASRIQNFDHHSDTLDSLLSFMSCSQSRTAERTKETGAWLSILLTTINGCNLSKGEFWDSLRMRYGLTLKDIATLAPFSSRVRE